MLCKENKIIFLSVWVVADSSKHVASGRIIDAGSICTNNCYPDMTDMTEGLTVDSVGAGHQITGHCAPVTPEAGRSAGAYSYSCLKSSVNHRKYYEKIRLMYYSISF